MKAAVRVAILVVVALVCVLAVMWIFNGPTAGTEAVGNANVAGGVVGVRQIIDKRADGLLIGIRLQR